MRRIETLAADSETLQSYLREIAKYPKLTIEQERDLGRRVQQLADQDALGTLVGSNLRFVVSYATRYRKLGVPLLDLIHEGNLGLIEGARRFDPDRNITLITHAAWWVRQSIMHLLSDAPRDADPDADTGSGRQVEALQAQLEHAPALSDRIDAIEVAPVDAGPFRAVDDASSPRGRMRGRHDGPLSLIESLPDLAVHQIEDEVMRETLVRQLEGAMTALDPKERQVMRLRYGLHGGEAWSIEQIGDRLRLSRRRIRQIESRATEKLRRRKSLGSYLN